MSGPSVLDYARYYGLATDAGSQNLLGLIKRGTTQENDCVDLPRDLSRPDYDELLRDDKMQVNLGAITVLAECTRPPPAPDWRSVLAGSQSTQRLKIAMPMLVSDHTRDMQWFKKGVDLSKLLVNCKETSRLESPALDDLSDILEQCERDANSTITEIENARVETTMEVLKILRYCSCDTWTREDMQDIVERDLKPAKPHPIWPLTSVLTPSVFSEEDAIPCLPPLPQLDIEPRSEVSLEADDLLTQVERISKVEDQVCTSDIEARSPNMVRTILDEASGQAPVDASYFLATTFEHTPETDQCCTPQDLKAEIPMVFSPPQSEQKPNPGKRVAFKDMFEEFIDFPSQDDSKDGDILKDEDPGQKLLIQRLEQYGADVTAEIMAAKPEVNEKALKAQIPSLDSTALVDPRAKSKAAKMINQKVKEMEIIAIQTKQAEETKLNWVPIPQKLTQIDLNEHVEEPGSTASFVEKPDKILRSEQLLYKEPGLRLLDADDEDDEVLEEDAELTQTLTADVLENIVPQKRRAGYVSDRGPEETIAQAAGPLGTSSAHIQEPYHYDPSDLAMIVDSHDSPPRQRSSPSAPRSKQQDRSQAGQNVIDDIPEPNFRTKKMKVAAKPSLWDGIASTDSFSAAGSLTSFLDLRGGKFKKPKERPNASPIMEEMDLDPILVSQRAATPSSDVCHPLARSGSLRHPKEHIEMPSTPNGECAVGNLTPLPEITGLSGQRTVIVDSAMVNNRQLFAFLERQGRDSLTIIYRELQGMPSVILSPKTCIIYTTFQALTQRSLPGQTARQCNNTPQQMIKHLRLEFETIFVLISMLASLRTSVSLSQMNTMTDFSSSCASIEPGFPNGQIVPLWIPIEDTPAELVTESPLCHWTWSLISRHAFRNLTTPSSQWEEEHIGIIQEETLWELFLRKAGMNAMAAQVILGRLKRPEGQPQDGMTPRSRPESERTWGLGKFISMPAEERLKLFGGLVGISAIERVNLALDCI